MKQKWTNTVWTRLVKPMLLIGFISAVFYYWLNFTINQSVILGFMFSGIYIVLKELEAKTTKPKDFEPYRVHVNIHWRDLLFKYKLLKNEEEWKQFVERYDNSSVVVTGINFTVLSIDGDNWPYLLYWDDRKIFKYGIPSFEAYIEDLKFPSVPGERFEWSPSIFFGHKTGKQKGYTMGLCVNGDWWESIKTPDITDTEVYKRPESGHVYLILATLPFGELGMDYKERGEDRDKELAVRGWKKIEQDYEMRGADIGVKHTYFSVSLNDIGTHP
jgi:hypothetical protein